MRKGPAQRFQHIDDVKVALAELREESDSGAPPALKTAASRKTRWHWAALAALPVLAAGGWLFWRLSERGLPPQRVVPLTSYAGSEGYATFSPDGNQVAFSWGGEKNENTDIYVKLIGETNALRLTFDPAVDSAPAWSPDGKRIAFIRSAAGESSGIYLVSPLGNSERKIAGIHAISQLSWSPDSKYLATARGPRTSASLVIVPVEGGTPRSFTSPNPPAYDWSPAFSRDGRQVAYAGCSGIATCDVFVLSLGEDATPRGAPRQVTHEEIYISGLAWSRDGKSLIYAASVAEGVRTHLWRVDSGGNRPPERLDTSEVRALQPAVSPTGNLMAFTRQMRNNALWRYRLGGRPEPFVQSSVVEWNPQFSPDGKKVVFVSDRGGDAFAIWMVDAEGGNPTRLTNQVGRYMGSPVWSPDGKLIAFDSQGNDGHWDIWVMGADGSNPRRLSHDKEDENMPNWSSDGGSIYYRSNRTGEHQIWRIPAAGGEAAQITHNGGHNAQESGDGTTLYFTKAYTSPIFAMSSAGGPEKQITEPVVFRTMAVVSDGIYYVGRRGSDRLFPLRFHAFSSGTSRLITTLEGVWNYGLTVSPDRKTFLYTRRMLFSEDLMLVENFR